MSDKPLVTEDEMIDCGEKIANDVTAAFYDSMTIHLDKLREKKMSYDDWVRVVTYALTRTCANHICAMMITLPDGDKAKRTMDVMSNHDRLLNLIVSDTFAKLKAEDQRILHA